MDNKKQNGVNMPPIYTLLIILLIISIAFIVRFSLNTLRPNEMDNSETMVYKNSMVQNRSKNQVLDLVVNGENVAEYKQKDVDNTYFIFINNLKRYLSYHDIQLGKAEYEQLQENMEELKRIINIEKESDFTKMSLDGRAVSIGIAKNIYELCGLYLVISTEGSIKQITDNSDNIIYSEQVEVQIYNIQISALIIVLCILLFLLVFILIYVKKNKLFRKEDDYNELNKKRYA